MLDPVRRLIDAVQPWPRSFSRCSPPSRPSADQGGRASQADPAVERASRPPATAPIPARRRPASAVDELARHRSATRGSWPMCWSQPQAG